MFVKHQRLRTRYQPTTRQLLIYNTFTGTFAGTFAGTIAFTKTSDWWAKWVFFGNDLVEATLTDVINAVT
jgi:hypothetical protein